MLRRWRLIIALLLIVALAFALQQIAVDGWAAFVFRPPGTGAS